MKTTIEQYFDFAFNNGYKSEKIYNSMIEEITSKSFIQSIARGLAFKNFGIKDINKFFGDKQIYDSIIEMIVKGQANAIYEDNLEIFIKDLLK